MFLLQKVTNYSYVQGEHGCNYCATIYAEQTGRSFLMVRDMEHLKR